MAERLRGVALLESEPSAFGSLPRLRVRLALLLWANHHANLSHPHVPQGLLKASERNAQRSCSDYDDGAS